MKNEKLLSLLANIKNGTYFRISYETEVPLSKNKLKKSEYDKDSFKITKITEATVRTGVNYGKLRSVIENLKSKESTKTRANNCEWVIKNRIKHNNVTGKDYLTVATSARGGNVKTLYAVTYKEHGVFYFSKEELLSTTVAAFIQDSYFNKTGNTPYYCVSLDNILTINHEPVRF